MVRICACCNYINKFALSNVTQLKEHKASEILDLRIFFTGITNFTFTNQTPN